MESPIGPGVPLRRHRRRLFPARGGFRTVELNIVGWSALVGAGLVLGAVVFFVTDLNVFVALALGVVMIWPTILVLDYRRWRNSKTHSSRDDMTDESGAEIVARLARLGIQATYEVHEDDPEDGGGIHRGIRYRNADAETVRRVTNELLGQLGEGDTRRVAEGEGGV
jgi:hypothetical protein